MQDYLEPKWQECAVCGSRFDASLMNRGKGIHCYCSKKCRTRADNQRAYTRRKAKEPLPQLDRTCVICGIGFVTDHAHPNALTCSQKCNQARMDRVRRQTRAKNTDLSPRACEECGELYTPNHHSAHKQKFCSHACANRVMQRRHTEKTRRPAAKRLGTAAWKLASKATIERDGNRCRSCGAQDRILSAHHIFHLTKEEEESCDLDGLLALCTPCHSAMHDIRLGKRDGEIIISGLVFRLLGITKVTVADGRFEENPQRESGGRN